MSETPQVQPIPVEQGQAARMAGQPRESCPYVALPERDEWLWGWTAAGLDVPPQQATAHHDGNLTNDQDHQVAYQMGLTAHGNGAALSANPFACKAMRDHWEWGWTMSADVVRQANLEQERQADEYAQELAGRKDRDAYLATLRPETDNWEPHREAEGGECLLEEQHQWLESDGYRLCTGEYATTGQPVGAGGATEDESGVFFLRTCTICHVLDINWVAKYRPHDDH